MKEFPFQILVLMRNISRFMVKMGNKMTIWASRLAPKWLKMVSKIENMHQNVLISVETGQTR